MVNPDSYITILSIMFPIWIGVFALYFFVIALRGILTKRPFLISHRWLLSMNEHFRISSTDTNLVSCIFFLVMGVLMVIGGIAMFFFFQRTM